MPFIRKSFYMIIGLTFPFFWAFHSTGFMNYLYLPLQLLTGSTGTGWPSFISAFCIYMICTVLFEGFYRCLYKTKSTSEFSSHFDNE